MIDEAVISQELRAGSSHSAAQSNNVGKDLSQQSVDFETAISHTGYGKFNYFLLLIAFPATCSNTFDTTSMSLALPSAACELQLTDFDKGCLNGAIFAGMISSAFLWGFLSDTFGRQRLLTIGYSIDAVFGLISGTSQTFCTILIFKFLSGVAICGPYSIFVAYLSELFTGKYRDSVIMSTGIFTSIGGIIQPIMAWYLIPKKMHYDFFNGAIRVNSWRIFILISTLPSIMAAVLTAFCVESPKFLMAQGRRDEALRVFRTIYAINTGKPAHTYPIKKLRDERRKSVIAEQAERRRQISNKALFVISSFWQQITALFKKPHLNNAVHVFSVQFAALLSMNTVRLWMPEFFFKIEQIPNVTSKMVCEIVLLNITRKVTNCDEITVDPNVYTKLIYVAFITTICFIGGSYLISVIGKEQFLLFTFVTASLSGWIFFVVYLHMGSTLLRHLYISITSQYCCHTGGCCTIFPNPSQDNGCEYDNDVWQIGCAPGEFGIYLRTINELLGAFHHCRYNHILLCPRYHSTPTIEAESQ
ncbi:synaptic vesicle glycoprotein 2A isoform X3 [Nilaparvata lugens]|uniref:synaptic vesicle glycoprotein 2A isoform X2 n=2 Tax=Nilaparvata lugens TaxID=108931 RepID=UPI00193D9E5D|nr:synaptic vesicle glycoprotein 2A isoform X2 [Nilaparvata lugens]XP_039290164.1 synaptic vesicle glycoprotein 2A isoform X3 [Nilaparvata lugens]